MKKIMMIVKGKRPLIDVVHYFIGNFRYHFYYGGTLSKKFAFIAWLRKRMIRQHIKEQINFRIKVMDKECYNNGECKLCGCQTTALQMADKACDKPCYPPLMDKAHWSSFNKGESHYSGNHIFLYDVKKNLYQIIKIKQSSKF
jgi:hypothetical protein